MSERVDGRPKIRLDGLTKVFGRDHGRALRMLDEGRGKDEVLDATGATVALHDVSFDIPRGRTFVVMGLSGSGKSTLARCINRLVEPTRGRIEVDGEDVVQMDDGELRELRRRKLGMVFQHFALHGHRTVLQNVAFGLEVQGVDEEERTQRAREVIDTVGLSGWEDAYPPALSGGMQQRVGLGRALAIDPDVLLMDEPFSGLDPLVRRELQDELVSLQEELRKTIVFITHDLDEALKMGAQMAILRGGEVVQVGRPADILRDPADDYVASFVEGVDPAQMLRAEDVISSDDGTPNDRTAVRADQPLRDVLRVIHAEGSPVPIVDGDGQRIGVVEEHGIVRSLAEAAGRDTG